MYAGSINVVGAKCMPPEKEYHVVTIMVQAGEAQRDKWTDGWAGGWTDITECIISLLWSIIYRIVRV